MKYLFLSFLLFAVAFLASAENKNAFPRYRITLKNQAEERGAINFLKRASRQLQMRASGVVNPKPGEKYDVIAVAYSPTVDQNDASPCVTASGSIVRRGIVATNFLPIGTRLKIGDEIFTVEDRMNAKYDGVPIIDIWHPTREEALAFGRKDLRIIILPREEQASSQAGSEETAEQANGFWEQMKDSFQAVGDLIGEFVATRTLPKDADCSKIKASK